MWFSGKRTYHTDEDLVRDYRQTGDIDLIGELFTKLSKTVMGACLFYLKDKDEAKDATMQIFEKFIKELRKKEIVNFNGWLSFVVRNHCLNLIKGNLTKYSKRFNHQGFEYLNPNEEEENYLEGISNDELIDQLHLHLNSLNKLQKQCIESFYIRNMSYKEISEAYHLTIAEIKSHIQNGKRNLKLLMQKHNRK